MISILIGWCIIGIYSYLYGRTVISILYKEREHVLKSVDIAVVSGFVFLNIFAQFFSIVYKVGMFAFVVVSVGAIVCLFYLWKKDILAIRTGQKHNAKMSMRTILTGVAIIGTLLWTNVVPQHYDTYLYHAQAIHWIEEYAVVPGLGNLHFRLAYNSAFMTLQALFSFAWLNGQSMHIVNGFIVLSMMIYGVCTFHRNERDAFSFNL